MKILFLLPSIVVLLMGVTLAQESLNRDEEIARREAESFAWKHSRLKELGPFSTDVVYQRLVLEVDPAVQYISGEVSSQFVCTADGLDTLQLDLHEHLRVDSVVSNGRHLTFQHIQNQLRVVWPYRLSYGEKAELCVYYRGVPAQSGLGSFVTSTHGNDSIPVLWTLSEPFGAMEWWPCKQSLSDKIDSLDVWISCPMAYTGVSNGLLVLDSVAGEQRFLHWRHRHPIATYLVAIAVTNYTVYADTLHFDDDRSMTVQNYVYPEELVTARQQTPITLKLLKFYNSLVGEYPFSDEKYGHAQWGWGGGMEHQTISFMVDFDFGLVAHELAHQWFGDYITTASWHDIWLNEGFATYLTAMAHEQMNPDFWLQWKDYTVQRVCSEPNGSVYVRDTTDVERIFDYRLSYLKGAYVLHMLRWLVGDNIFKGALKAYFQDSRVANGFATVDNFRLHVETLADTSLVEFFNDWYYGEGYPVYSITYTQQGHLLSMELSQEQSDESVDFFEMPVPVRLFSKNRADTLDLRLNQVQNHQHFEFNVPFLVSEVLIDPEHWLICKKGQITGVSTPKSGEVRLFPNPAGSRLNLELPAGMKVTSIEIVDLNGACQKRFDPHLRQLRVQEFSAGSYLLVIQTDTGPLELKWIKQ